LPVIFLTGHGTIPLCAQAIKAGAIDFLLKPVEEQALLAAIVRAIEVDYANQAWRHQRADLAWRVKTLTPRERDVMALVVTGLLNKQIAAILGTREKTIKVHRAQVMQKMQAESLAALVRMADAVGMGESRALQGAALASTAFRGPERSHLSRP
jgi:FixJ family two-component response regulator